MRLFSCCAMVALLSLSPVHAAETTVQGTVTDSVTGLPVQGASVSLRTDHSFIPCYNAVSPTVTSAADGGYAVTTTYEHGPCLSVTAGGYLSQQITLPSFGPDGGTVQRDVALVPYPRVEVLVRDLQSGQPIEGATVLGAISGPDGIAVLDRLEPGDYYVCANASEQGYAIACVGEPMAWHTSAGTSMTLVAGQQYEFTLELQSGGRIDVELREADTTKAPPTYAITLEVRSLDAEVLASRYVSASDGRFPLHGLPPGAVYVVARPATDIHFVSTIYPDVQCCDFAAATPLDVVAGEVLQAVIDVEPQSVVTGRITDAVTGAPLEGMQVIAYEFASILYRRVAIGQSGADGGFRLSWLRAGSELYLGALARDGYGSLSWPDVSCYEPDCHDGDSIVVALHELRTGIDFALDRGEGISGTVISSIDDALIAGAWVRLWEGGLTLWSGTTDHEGRYFSPAMPASTYRVSAGIGGACAGHPASECSNSDYPGPDAADIIHGGADSTGIDVLLDAPATPVFVSGFETG